MSRIGYRVNRPYKFSPVLWDDVRVPITSVRVGPAADPTFAQFRDDGAASTGVFAYDFSALVEEMVYFVVQLPHGYKLGTDIRPHVHWATKTTTGTGTVTWALEYTVAAIGADFGTTATVTGTHTFGGDEQWKHQVTSLTAISGAALTTLSSMLSCRLYRDVAADNYADEPSLLEVDFHIQLDSLGSGEETAK